MRVLGVDTASEPRGRGYAIAEGGRPVWWGKAPPEVPGAVDFVVGERPWLGAKLRGAALISFCVNNGFQLRDAWPATGAGAPPPFVLIPVRDWKNLALPGCAGMPGDVFCANLRQRFAPSETDTDILDAIGIAVAASRLTHAQLKKLIPKGFRR
jgi:hypothetical protein